MATSNAAVASEQFNRALQLMHIAPECKPIRQGGLHICRSINNIGKDILSWICRTDSLHSYAVMLPDHVSSVVLPAIWSGTSKGGVQVPS